MMTKEEIATMLRQQQAEIEVLKDKLNKQLDEQLWLICFCKKEQSLYPQQ